MKYLTFLITLLSISFAQPWVSFDLKYNIDYSTNIKDAIKRYGDLAKANKR